MLSIWEYADVTPDGSALISIRSRVHWQFREARPYKRDHSNSCIYCAEELTTVKNLGPCAALACSGCGWWIVLKETIKGPGYEGVQQLDACWGTLRNLDVSDVSEPLDELQEYLRHRYDERFKVNPRKYEELVESVFAGCGYTTRLTSYSRDRGIDVFILDGQGNDLVGIQVKRYKGKIEAEQIRSLAGALVQHEITKGIFITTSSFRPGAVKEADEFRGKGLAIELCDAEAFYDRLEMAQRPPYTTVDDPDAPFSKVLESRDSVKFWEYSRYTW